MTTTTTSSRRILLFPKSPPAITGLDSFIGPGATKIEIIFQFTSALIIGICCYVVYKLSNPSNISSTYSYSSSWFSERDIIVFLIGIDMAGGVVTNATSSAKRWYHREGQGFHEHLSFIVIHGAQIGIVSYMFINDRTDQFIYFGLVHTTLIVFAGIVLSVPLYMQRPVAVSFVAITIPLSMIPNIVPQIHGLEWFIPLLFVKLLISHVTIEMPFQPDDIIEYK